MGQHCVKLTSSATAVYTSPSTKSSSTLTPQSASMCVDAWIARESQVRRASSHPFVVSLLQRLPEHEVDILLVSQALLCCN